MVNDLWCRFQKATPLRFRSQPLGGTNTDAAGQVCLSSRTLVCEANMKAQNENFSIPGSRKQAEELKVGKSFVWRFVWFAIKWWCLPGMGNSAVDCQQDSSCLPRNQRPSRYQTILIHLFIRTSTIIISRYHLSSWKGAKGWRNVQPSGKQRF